MRTVALVARAELVRFLRRRSTVWLFVSLAVVTLLAGLSGRALAVRVTDAGAGAEAQRNASALTVLVALSAFAASEGGRSFVEEQERGSWAVLSQTPTSAGSLVLGKVAGVVASVFVLNGFLQLFVVVATPLVRLSYVGSLALLLLPAVVAALFVPEGVAYVRARTAAGGPGPLAAVTAGRLLGHLGILELFAMRSDRAPGRGAMSLLVDHVGSLVNLGPRPDYGVDTRTLVLALLAWQVVSGLWILYRFALREEA